MSVKFIVRWDIAPRTNSEYKLECLFGGRSQTKTMAGLDLV